MSLSEYVSLTFIVSLEYEEILKGYFLVNHDVQGFEESSTGLLTVFLLREDWSEVTFAALKTFLATLPPKEVSLTDSEEIEEKDWNAAWEAEIEPVKISDELVITPSWKIEDARTFNSKYYLTIDPKMSFGTGHHETTRLCLRAMEGLDTTGKTILDIGTGTGALAMYGLLRGARHAVGIDTDEWSFKNVVENRERNRFTDVEFAVRHGDLAATVTPGETFDIILANIHRNVLLLLPHAMTTHHNPNGRLIISGILEYDTEEVLSAYQNEGYTLKRKMQENEWMCLDLELIGR